MKNLIFILSMFCVSCSPGKEELIKQFEETTGNTKTDLFFKVKEIHLIGTITAKDSLEYYVKLFKDKFYDSPNSSDEILKMIKTELSGEANEKLIDSLKNSIVENKTKGKEYQVLQDVIDRYEPMIILGKKVQRGIEKYSPLSNEIIGNKWQCTYTIKNPMLNNTKQEITNQYLFNGNNSKLISRLIDQSR